MRVTLLSLMAGVLVLAGCTPADRPMPDDRSMEDQSMKMRDNVVRFSPTTARNLAAARDTIIRSKASDTFIVHLALPDSCLKKNPPPPCPPLLSATRTDTIIR